jgi:hypothetical protein
VLRRKTDEQHPIHRYPRVVDDDDRFGAFLEGSLDRLRVIAGVDGEAEKRDSQVTAGSLQLRDSSPAASESKGKGRRASPAHTPVDKRCGAPTLAGLSCRTRPLTNHPSGQCRYHACQSDPALAAVVRADRQRGGAVVRLRDVGGLDLGDFDLSRPADCRQVLAQTAHAVASGKIPASVAGAIVQVVNAAVRVAEVTLNDTVRKLDRAIAEAAAERARGARR